MDIRNNYISIEQMQNQYLNNNNIKAKTIDSNISFEDVLKEFEDFLQTAQSTRNRLSHVAFIDTFDTRNRQITHPENIVRVDTPRLRNWQLLKGRKKRAC